MSELSHQIAANTQGVYGAHRDLVAIKARNRDRKKQAFADIATTIKEAGDEYRKNLSWRDAQAAEREVLEVENAYALGYSTKGGEGARVALSALKPKTARGAITLSARLREAAGDQRYDVEWKAKEAERAVDRQAKRKADLMDSAISYAELEVKKAENARRAEKEARDEAFREKELTFKTQKELLDWWQSRKPEKRPDMDDLPVPDNQRTMVEKRHGLPDGYLSGVSHKQMREMLAADTARTRADKPASEPNLRLTPYETQTLKGIDAEIAQLAKFIDTNAWEKSQADSVNKARERLAALRSDRVKIEGNLPGSPTRQAPVSGAPAPVETESPDPTEMSDEDIVREFLGK